MNFIILNKSFLLFLKDICARANAINVPISICGEAAGDPKTAIVFALLGFRQLSMPASGVGPVKKTLRSINISELLINFEAILGNKSAELEKDLLSLLKDYVQV